MAVSAETAARAIELWSLEGGVAIEHPSCRCRFWTTVDPYGRTAARLVYTCPQHRPGWSKQPRHTARDD